MDRGQIAAIVFGVVMLIALIVVFVWLVTG